MPWLAGDAIPSSLVVQAPSTDVALTDLAGETHTLADRLTTFPMAVVVLDPYTHESSWILDTARRLFAEYSQADVRVCFAVTADAAGTRSFLGPVADEYLAFADPQRALVEALDLDTLPALVAIRQDGQLIGSAEGWDPDRWREVTAALSELLAWHRPTLPGPDDPSPYSGTAARG